ncbi:MAG: alpha/beta hydrolase [Solirubrobacterales bacterium]|nr:alpha/beta hydrolase [Solirubrobacterales bacterium]
MRRAASAPTPANAGTPVLFLTGVGLTAAVARRSIAALQERFRVLEPRLGNSGKAQSTLVPTAEAALGLLDGDGAEQAHVVGLSFGATVAQEMAIRHPQRVRSLILGSSTAGGQLYVGPEPDVRDFVGRLEALPAEEALWASVPYLYAAGSCRRNAPLIGEDIAQRLREPLHPKAYGHQRAAARDHDTAARLPEITAPTLVIHGEQDRILPIENGRRLAAGIAGARFMPLPGAAHAFPTDLPETTRRLVSFLLEHSPRRRRSPAPRTGRATRA